jgi:Gpi18-like mannosyltransferase
MKRLSSAVQGAFRLAWNRLRELSPQDLLILLAGIGFSVLVRYLLLDFKSSDFFNSLKPWYVTIRTMGFSAFATDFTTYNPPYLYEMYLIARYFPDTSNLLATKIPSLIGDFIGAYFVYVMVRLKYPHGVMAPLAAFAFLLTPTVVLNSAFWGQADILFTAPLIASLYFLMKGRISIAMIAFGISLAFKLQAVFLAPLLFGLFLRGGISWRHLLLVLLVLLAAIIPAAVAGRPIVDLLLVYVAQAEQYQLLQMSAPTVYTWMPDVGLTQRFFTSTGVVFTAALGFALSILIWRSSSKLSRGLLLRLALLCCLFMPFFLPKMHDRYFYPADVLSIIFAFYFPRFFFVPIVIILASFFAYQPTLFSAEPVPMSLLALGMFTMLVVVARDSIARLLAKEPQSHPTHAPVESGP